MDAEIFTYRFIRLYFLTIQTYSLRLTNFAWLINEFKFEVEESDRVAVFDATIP